MLVDDRRLRTRTAKGGAWGKDELQVFIRFVIPKDPFGDLEQPAKLDQARNARTDRRLESLFADPAEAECADPGLVGDTEQVVAFYKRANRATSSLALASGEPVKHDSAAILREILSIISITAGTLLTLWTVRILPPASAHRSKTLRNTCFWVSSDL